MIKVYPVLSLLSLFALCVSSLRVLGEVPIVPVPAFVPFLRGQEATKTTPMRAVPVPNGGFETVGNGAEPFPGWIVGIGGGADATIVPDATVAHSGMRSARLTNRSPEKAFVYALLSSAWIPVSPRTTYVARCWVRGKGVRKAYLAVAFQSGGEQRHELPAGDFEWRQVSITVNMPDNCHALSLHFASDDIAEALWADDFTLEVAARQQIDLVERRYPKPFPGVFPRSTGPVPQHLLVYDASAQPVEIRRAVAALQGLVNRTRPRLYVISSRSQPGEDADWLKYMQAKGYTGTPEKIDSLSALFARFRKEFDGAILPDPELPGTVNAAYMLAGLLKALPATPELAAQYHLPILMDLRGRWKRNVDAYRFVYDHYWPRLNHHILSWEYPLADYQGARDYMVEFNIFTFWLSSDGDHEKGADPEAEEAFVNELLANTPANIPVMGWPTVETGEKGGTKGITEYACVRWLSEYGKFVPGTGFCANLSVHTAIHPQDTLFQQKVLVNVVPPLSPPASGGRTSTPLNPPASGGENKYPLLAGGRGVEKNRVYLSLNIMDSGDALWYWQRYQRKIWADPNRGALPIGWCMNPTLYDTLPLVMQWYYEHATPNDTFFAAVSGLGYMNTQVYASRFRATDSERIWDAYVHLADTYRRKADMEGIALYDGGWGECSPPAGLLERFLRVMNAPPRPLAYILADLGRHDNIQPDNAASLQQGVAVFHTLTRYQVWASSTEVQHQEMASSNAWLLQEILSHTPKQRPAFMSSMAISWYYSPTWLKDLQSRLPPEVEIVSLHELARRYREVK